MNFEKNLCLNLSKSEKIQTCDVSNILAENFSLTEDEKMLNKAYRKIWFPRIFTYNTILNDIEFKEGLKLFWELMIDFENWKLSWYEVNKFETKKEIILMNLLYNVFNFYYSQFYEYIEKFIYIIEKYSTEYFSLMERRSNINPYINNMLSFLSQDNEFRDKLEYLKSDDYLWQITYSSI